MPIFAAIREYAWWLHLRWPAGTVEPLPIVREAGQTNLPGVRLIGDLAGLPLLKFSAESAARAVAQIKRELSPNSNPATPVWDVIVVGAGAAGVSAGLELQKTGLRFQVLESAQLFNTIVNFPAGKPIYTYPVGFTPKGGLRFTGDTKESLLTELLLQTRRAQIPIVAGEVSALRQRGSEVEIQLSDGRIWRARRVLLAIGRSGNYRKLDVPGEDLPHVFHRLFDPSEFHGRKVVVVGAGDAAIEGAYGLATAGASASLVYRGDSLHRAKPENVERIENLGRSNNLEGGSLKLIPRTQVTRIEPDRVFLRDEQGNETQISANAVFLLIGREAPLPLLRRSGLRIRDEWTWRTVATFALFILFCCFLYLWKGGTDLQHWFEENHWFPFNIPDLARAAGLADPKSFLGTVSISLAEPGFYYSLAYCLLVLAFGIRRLIRRPTVYVRWQTTVLTLIQIGPLFLLPYILLPWMGHNGVFDHGWGKLVADNLMPAVSYGQGREYWRAFGLVLAWPLFVWNIFTDQPLWWWLIISILQTGVIVPLIVWRWGKGAYCGWICSCGALAETLGDGFREKMPHGPVANRLNLIGQVVLGWALLMLLLRVVSWIAPGLGLQSVLSGLLNSWHLGLLQLNYYQLVDIFLAGVIGVGFYFWFSGRVWCRFACPLAALMHIFARFSRFRIFADKKKCISCNVCTSVCHQGIDVMSFANRGLPMEDPQCVRCSACVQMCPTNVLSFGRLDSEGQPKLDRLPAFLPGGRH